MLTFSLVIPNRNQSHFLPFALESLRHQSVPFHLAVMDGGSTDNFNEVLEEYADITADRSTYKSGVGAKRSNPVCSDRGHIFVNGNIPGSQAGTLVQREIMLSSLAFKFRFAKRKGVL